MEAFWLRRTKISSSSADRTSGGLLASVRGPGNRLAQKQRNFPKPASDSSSCGSDTTHEDSFTFELGLNSSKQSVGTPMKKLLAQEMSKENDSKRRPPSVIARLMGLDALPSQQTCHKQHRSAENSQEKAQKSCSFYSRRSSRKSSKEEQEFKDVFEVLDAEPVDTSSHSSPRTGNLKITDAEMAFIRQKFMDAKRLSTDEKLQDSKEFYDALEVLDSNKDLLLKFLQQPDSLFTKHLHDLQGAPPQSHCGRLSSLKPSKSLNYENSRIGRREEGENLRQKHHRSPKKYQEVPLHHSHGKYATHNSFEASKVQLVEKSEPAILPTRIVVLKPNLGRSQNVDRTIPSPRLSHHYPSDCRKHAEIGIGNRDAEIWERKKVYDDAGISRKNSRESREIAKEITRQMKDGYHNASMNYSISAFKGYAGDESSCDISGSESANDSDVTTLTSRNNFDWHKHRQPSSSRSTESFVSKEAKRRLSERWKMTHRSQEVHLASRGSTLGEMLAISGTEVRTGNFSGTISEKGFSVKFGGENGVTTWNEPLGISSRDGWKDGCLANLSRSRSLPASSSGFGSPRTSMHCENLCNDKFVMPKENRKKERCRAVKGTFSHREGWSSRNSRISDKKCQVLSYNSDKENHEFLPKIHLAPYQVKGPIEEENQCEQNLLVLESSASSTIGASPVSEDAVNVKHLDKNVLAEPSYQESSFSASADGDLSATGIGNVTSQEPSDSLSQEASLDPGRNGSESGVSSKESDQPSPVSILEAPFTDDLSSGSECFESLSADLQGLRMQLHLLKLESEAYEEGTMLVSSDDETDEKSIGYVEDRGIIRPEDNWESSYIVDVLEESGINGTDPDAFVATWHSAECPVNPLVFEEVEKRYFSLTSSTRAERRLMFDCVNAKLLEVHQQFTDQLPWVKYARKVLPKWKRKGLEERLRILVGSNDKILDINAAEKVLGRETEWLELREDVDVMGKEIEKLLIDELVAEMILIAV